MVDPVSQGSPGKAQTVKYQIIVVPGLVEHKDVLGERVRHSSPMRASSLFTATRVLGRSSAGLDRG